MKKTSKSKVQLLAEVEALKKQVADLKETDREREQAETALRESEKKFRFLFEEMISGFALHEIICDDTGKPVDYRFLEVNPAFETLTGLRAERIIGKTVLEVLPDTEPYWIENYGKVALTGEPARFENYSRELKRYYSVTAYCPQKGRFAVVFNDITDRIKAQEALQRANEELQKFNLDLEKLVQEKTNEIIEKNRCLAEAERLAALGKMANRIAHELRNPLTVVGGFAQRICDVTPDEDPKKRYCNIILGEIETIEKKVTEIIKSRDEQ